MSAFDLAPVAKPDAAVKSRRRIGVVSQLGALLGLLRIGVLRSWGWIVIPVMVLIGAVFVHQELIPGVVLWDNLSTTTGSTTMFLAPLAMGYTAWRSQATKRARMTELESVAPMSPLVRDLSRILSSTLIVVIGQILLVVVALGYGARLATWGSPLWWPLALSVVTIFTAGAIGGVVGMAAPWRLAPPVIALVTLIWFLATESGVFGNERSGTLRMFSPYAVAEREHVDPFWNQHFGGLSQEFTMLVALAGVAALACFAVARNRSVITVFLAAIVCGSVVFGGAMHRDRWTEAMRPNFVRAEPRQFEYTCELWGLNAICLHPAYASMIDDLRTEADRVLAPLAGLPGLPTVIRHMSGDQHDDGTTIWTGVRSLDDEWEAHFGHSVIRQVIGLGTGNEGFPNLRSGRPTEPDAAQMVIGRWLSEEAGFDSYQLFGGVPPSDMQGEVWFADWTSPEPGWSIAVRATEERFAALPPDEQRSWLEANWDALRAGDLTLEDLP